MGRPKKRRTPNPQSRKQNDAPSKKDAAKKSNRASNTVNDTLTAMDGPSHRRTASEQLIPLGKPSSWPSVYWLAIAALSAVFLYSYWPTLRWMADAWMNEPDYSHGWVVPVLAGMICYYRADSFPGIKPSVSWGGLSLIVLAILMRFASRMTYTDFSDGWSMLPMIAGTVWCLLGSKALVWALPAIGFLIFAVPMPYQAESMLSWKLQGVATELSTIVLRVLGQPAVSEGHIVWIGAERLSIEEACSGLRIFVGMGAFAYYWAAINQRGWSDKIVILACAVPAAILVNSLRIVLIGLLNPVFQSDSAHRWIHDISGILMIFASFAIMGLVNLYWQKLYAPVRKLTAKEILRESGVKYAP